MKLDTLIEAAKVAIKKMLVEQNSIKAMEKQEFESRFTKRRPGKPTISIVGGVKMK